MYSVTGTEITLSRGDTGAMKVTAKVKRRDTGGSYTFGERDRALFSIKAGNGQVVKQKAYPMRDNVFTVVFANTDTDQLTPGGYTWDVRYVINPYYDTDPPEGEWPEYEDLTFPVAKGGHVMHGGTYYFAAEMIESAEEWNPDHWVCADWRVPVDGDQVITPKTPMNMNLLTVVGEI